MGSGGSPVPTILKRKDGRRVIVPYGAGMAELHGLESEIMAKLD